MLFALVSAAEAQQKVTRIGYLSNSDPPREFARAETIRLALRELGYIEGQNIVTEYRYADGKSDVYPERAADLVRLNVDIIIVAGGSGAVRAVKNATKTIPIVMVGPGLDPVEAGLVESLARPGGNITGVTNIVTELGGKRLELLKEVVPRLSRVGVIYNPAIRSNVFELKEVLPASARGLSLTIKSWEKKEADDFEKVFAALSKERPDGLYLLTGTSRTDANRKRIVSLALKNRLPSIHANSDAVDVGGLMSYAADQPYSYRRVATYVDKILKGAKPADLPVEQPAKFELVINLKTAKQIGLTIPPNVLARADRVIR